MVTPTTTPVQSFRMGTRQEHIFTLAGDDSSAHTPYILLDDIQNVFPQAASFSAGGVNVEYMRNAQGEEIHPLRIAHQPGTTIEVTADMDESAGLPSYTATTPSSDPTSAPTTTAATPSSTPAVADTQHQLEVELATSSKATEFYRALSHDHGHVRNLKVTFKFAATVSDLKAFRDAILGSNITALHFCCATLGSSGGLDLFSKTKLADPLWQMVSDPDAQTRNKIRSLTIHDFSGFFKKVSSSSKDVARSNRLTTFKISEKVDWKADEAKVLNFLKRSPELKELSLRVVNVEQTYESIRKIMTTSSMASTLPSLTLLTLVSGEFDAISVQFDPQTKEPLVMDLAVSKMATSELIKKATYLRSVKVSAGLYGNFGAECKPLVEILQRNSRTLTKMVVNCNLTEFYPIFSNLQKFAKEHQVNTGEKGIDNRCRLRELTLLHYHNKMTTTNLVDDHSTVLELLSLNVKVDGGLNNLLKTYGFRLFKLRVGQHSEISGSDWKALEWSTRVPGQGTAQLTHLTMTCSQFKSEAVLDEMRAVIERSKAAHPDRPLEELAVRIDIHHKDEDPALVKAWSQFIMDYGPEWTEIVLVHFYQPPWVEMMKESGRIPRLDDILLKEMTGDGVGSIVGGF